MRLVSIIQVVMAGNFAKNSAKPVSVALFRVTIACAIAATVSHILAKSLIGYQLPTDVPLRIMIVLVALIGFVICGLLQLSRGQRATQVGTGARGVFWLLPLRRSERIIAEVLPGLITVSILFCLGSAIIGQIASAMQLSWLALQLSWCLGLSAGLGVSIYFDRQIVRTILLFITIIIVSMRLLQMVYISQSEMITNYIPYVAQIVVLWPVYGYVRMAKRKAYGVHIQESKQHPAVIPEKVPTSWWMLVKIWRNNRTRTSFFIIFSLSIILAGTMTLRKLTIENPYPYMLISATLVATFCCELRGLMRRVLPPEAVTLRGIRSVIFGEFGVGLTSALLIGLPLLLALQNSPQVTSFFVISYLVYQVFGACAGMIAGSIFVPQNDEMGSQFFAALASSAIVIGLPKFLSFRYEVGGISIPQCLGLLLVLCIGSLVIESLRRKRYGGT